MNLKRAFLTLMAAMILPGAVYAQDLAIGITATVDFSDGNTEEMITVDFSCNDGNNPVGQAILGDGGSFRHPNDGLAAGFVCTVTGSDVNANYSVTYNGSADPCSFTEAGEVTCAILATPDNATITVTKFWDVTGAGGEAVDESATIEARADIGVLADGGICDDHNGVIATDMHLEECVYLDFNGDGDTASVSVITGVDGETVTFTENNEDSAVEVSNDCGAVEVFPGDDVDCSFTNTVFFEGIPTLSQYGLAIMALLMLGVGFVGFRRFV
ncbi:MAG: IPTL-CTERM sorting domain-containing protein [Xanthomonadales bacterium]|nr:IPTL-CTERM sorting domain-containing protein [Gammaproteobacteria bacterium]MBT8053860.1 IPTL-CTERM sorting domain-containing protein [Gammaproteobacteria bacterium]NND58343.1 IPTL-CTERM sorting domain-containing protein [Xanthomonadales bacterium]NNK51829.1 IPTL-CTERM sorting domain-containing protein [Xanthomonadales bacterium]